ncbi:MAG: hypothetical protein H6590_01230 [Flavobacteriales bacterium]|nr:hypothetical protein [Flavobacteriales bacterium]MCB9178034.1 hypothetical protein [Flavobacteriales bacterium]
MINFDINEVVAGIAEAVSGSVGSDWNDVKPILADFIQRNQSRWTLLVELRLEGVLDEDEFLQRLKDEERLLESQLHAIIVIKKVVAQNAANAAIKVLKDAVKAALDLAL